MRLHPCTLAGAGCKGVQRVYQRVQGCTKGCKGATLLCNSIEFTPKVPLYDAKVPLYDAKVPLYDAKVPLYDNTLTPSHRRGCKGVNKQ